VRVASRMRRPRERCAWRCQKEFERAQGWVHSRDSRDSTIDLMYVLSKNQSPRLRATVITIQTLCTRIAILCTKTKRFGSRASTAMARDIEAAKEGLGRSGGRTRPRTEDAASVLDAVNSVPARGTRTRHGRGGARPARRRHRPRSQRARGIRPWIGTRIHLRKDIR
jgi:hypothetical protein